MPLPPISKRLAIRGKGGLVVSALDKARAAEREQGLEVGQNSDRIVAKLKARSSGKVHVSPRADPLQDRDIFKEIQASLRAGASVALAARSRGPVTRRKIPIDGAGWVRINAEIRKARRQHKDQSTWLKTMWIPHWDHTGDRLRAMAWAMAMHDRGARTLNLNLGPEVVEAGRAHREGLAIYVRRRISQRLKAAADRLGLPVPEFFFVLEDSDLGNAHLHGAILLPEAAPAYKAFRAALVAAGGKWRGGGSARQLNTVEMDTPVRWISYVGKWLLFSAVKIEGRTFAASHGVRNAGRDWYRQARSSGLILRPGPAYQDTGIITF
jgi:hypothetical protein